MRRIGSIIALVVAWAVLTPTAACAQHASFRGQLMRGGGDSMASRPSVARSFAAPSFAPRPPTHRLFPRPVPRAPIVPRPVHGPSIAYFVGERATDDGLIAYYAPSAGGAATGEPASAPVPSVIEFPTGRYELEGDGTEARYRWVWIPKPQPGPPSAAPTPPLPEPKIINVPDGTVSVSAGDSTAPKVISIPPEDQSSSKKRSDDRGRAGG